MASQKKLIEKLRSIFFELISDVATYSYDELLFMLAQQLNSLLHTKHAAIYVYNNWDKKYELSTNGKHGDELLDEIMSQFINQNLSFIERNQIVQGTVNYKETYIIPLQLDKELAGFLLFSVDKDITKELVDSLKCEIEQFLKIINYYQVGKDNERKSKFLYDLTSHFYSSINKNDILTETTRTLRKLYPRFTFYILLSQDYKADSTLPVKEIEYSDDATKRVSTQAFITGEVQLEDRVKEKKSCLYAPLRGNQGVYGVIQFVAPQTVDYSQEEIEFITEIANIVGKAIENATLYQHSRHLVKDLKRINDATHQLNSNLKIAEITEVMRQQIMDTCNATQVGFIYSNEESDKLFDVLSGSTDYFYTKQGQAFAEYLINQMNTEKEAIFSGDLSKDFNGLPYRSVMAIPMLQSAKIYGVIVIMHDESYYFSFENFKLMQSLIQHSTLALTNSILKEKLENAVIKDYLTKLYSRKYLDEKIQLHMETDEKGTLILFDIDDFKMVNDTYGHHVGDEVIIQVAQIITLHLGQNDIPARWGGEELAIYLPDVSIDDGVFLASQIRKQVENFTNPLITLSCGVSTWSGKSNDSVRDVFLRADKALYEAKKIGKNCVVKGEWNSQFSLTEESAPNQ
ncbi:sensor domain-containing diguanylate cyclase [Virgibacillus ndiopensis]|uniref:sensor domain-containing diguanylate cyclase n=1 Tax=Virgibacillus ndiopensis TaxID=2004408 RepID=UPI000C06A3BB|nr:diguanylate cyclase [Virgibacillus ndiopensis]